MDSIYDALDALIGQALVRHEEKGETVAQAAEAVTGGNRDLDALIVRALVTGDSLATLTAYVERRPRLRNLVKATR
jgi:hypothetical protein